MDRPSPVPPQHMHGAQRMMPQGQQGQQRPPPQQFQPQGQFLPPQFPQQPHQFQQQGRPVINDIRFAADRPINGLAKIRSIVAPRETTEKDVRKQLTTYEAYAITPTVDEDAKKDKDSNKRSSSGKDKKADKKKETWTKALVVQEILSHDAIAKAIKKLDEREDVARKLRELGQNQRTQVSNVLDDKLLQDRDAQFAWEVAQLHREFKNDSSGAKKTKCITLYLKRAPKPHVDCMEIIRRRDQQKFQQQQQQQQNAEHARNVQAMRQQDEINQIQQQVRQRQLQQMGGGMVPGPMDPPMGGRERGGGLSPGVVPIHSDSGSDSSSNSSSDSESDSEVSSNTSHPVSTRPSRSDRHGRRDKPYYGRGTSRVRSRSHARGSREKDYTVVHRHRIESRRDHSPRGVHYVPESPRSPPPRASSRLAFGRANTYSGRPTVEVHSPRQSRAEFFDLDQHSPRMVPRPIIHNQGRPEVVSAPSNVEIIAAAVQAGMQAGQKAARDEKLTADIGALTLQQPVAEYREPRLPRPPMPHSAVSDFVDRRSREREREREYENAVARAEALQRQDELLDAIAIRRAVQTRSPPRGPPRDFDRPVPRNFRGADLYDPYSSASMSPSLSSGSSGVSYSSGGRRDPYDSRGREYEYRGREASHFDSDREEYDFIGRDEANPFRPLHQRRPSSRSRPPPVRRGSFRSEVPFSPRGY